MSFRAALLAAERGRFLLWLPVALLCGVLAYFALPMEPPLWAGLLAFVLLAGLAFAVRRCAAWFALCLMAASVAAGFASGSVATWRAAPVEALPARAVIVRGVVGLVEALPDGRRMTLERAAWGAQAALRRDVRVRLHKGDLTALSVGDEVQVRALLRATPMPAWPGAWDLQRDAFYANRAGGGTALGMVEVIGRWGQSGVGQWWQGVRQRIADRVAGDLPGPTGAIAATLFTGLGGAIAPEDRAAFRDAGLAHLLAVAGLHIGAVMGAVFAGVRLLLASFEWVALRWPCKQVAGVAALLAGLLYLLLTGAHVPIQRSFAMAALVTLGLLTGRRTLSLRGLGLAAAVILLVSPEEAVGVSFQMSFAAVMALIAGYEVLRPVLARLHGGGWRRRGLAHLALLGLTSLLAGGASMPIAAYHFGHVQPWFVPANLVAVPLTALVAIPAGIVGLLLMPFGLEQAGLQPMGWVIGLVLWIARWVASWPAATLLVPQMPNWGLLCVSGGLCWLCLWRSNLRWLGAAPLLLGVASYAWVAPPDLLVSSDARLIAWRGPEGAWAQSKGGARFVRDSWAQMWGVAAIGKSDTAGCEQAGCVLRVRTDGPAIWLSRSGERTAVCGAVGLVASAVPARDACPALPLIDRFTVWRDGAQAVWLWPKLVVVSDRAVRGVRPWVPPVPMGHGQVPDLPMAALDR